MNFLFIFCYLFSPILMDNCFRRSDFHVPSPTTNFSPLNDHPGRRLHKRRDETRTSILNCLSSPALLPQILDRWVTSDGRLVETDKWVEVKGVCCFSRPVPCPDRDNPWGLIAGVEDTGRGWDRGCFVPYQQSFGVDMNVSSFSRVTRI